MTQQELAAASGCTVATISDLESGRNRQPSHTKVVSIVRALRANGLPGAMIEDLFPVALVPLVARPVRRAKRKSRWTPHPRT
jgi:transcriptional regulator with XRE-family HTH domain